MEGLSGWEISSMAGPRDMKEIHIIYASIHSNKVNMKGWLWQPNGIRRPCGPKAPWHLSYRWRKPRKNLAQETCPDRESNPGPLRDRCACYRLLHSGFRIRQHQSGHWCPYEWFVTIMIANDIRGWMGPKFSWHLSYGWGKTPKNLTQETCPDRESNPGPLHDRCACYRLLHSGMVQYMRF